MVCTRLINEKTPAETVIKEIINSNKNNNSNNNTNNNNNNNNNNNKNSDNKWNTSCFLVDASHHLLSYGLLQGDPKDPKGGLTGLFWYCRQPSGDVQASQILKKETL